MSNKIKKGPKPLLGQNSKFKIENSKLVEEHSVLSPRTSVLPDPNSELKTQNSELPHALASPTHPRIDILHGGNQAATMRDMLKLVRSAVAKMQAGESALVINTSASHALMEEAAEKISKRQAASVIAFSATGDDLMQRLEFLANVIQTKGVRLLVVSSFEFAACASRQRNKLVHWLRRMRDEHNIRIVVYSLERNTPQPGATGGGPLGLLAWTSDLVREIHNADAEPDFTELPNANQTLLEEIENLVLEIKNDPDPLIQNSELKTQNSPTPDTTQDSALSTQDYPDITLPDFFNPDPGPRSPDPDPSQHSALSTLNSARSAPLRSEPLINNDLQPQQVFA